MKGEQFRGGACFCGFLRFFNRQMLVGPTGKMPVLQTSAIEQRCDNFFGFKNFLRYRTSYPRVTTIIGVNFPHCFFDIRKFSKTEEPASIAIEFREAGFLGNHRPARSQITGTTITEPAGV